MRRIIPILLLAGLVACVSNPKPTTPPPAPPPVVTPPPPAPPPPAPPPVVVPPPPQPPPPVIVPPPPPPPATCTEPIMQHPADPMVPGSTPWCSKCEKEVPCQAPPPPPPPSTTTVVRVTSVTDKTISLCLDKATGNAVRPCPSTAIQTDSYRKPCQGAAGAYAADVRHFWLKPVLNPDGTPAKKPDGTPIYRQVSGLPPDYHPNILWLIPKSPAYDGFSVIEHAYMAAYPNGIDINSMGYSTVQTKAGGIESCGPSADFGGRTKDYTAGLTAINAIASYIDISGLPPGSKIPIGYDVHGFKTTGIFTTLPDGTPWTKNAAAVATMNSWFAAHPATDGCKDYPCK